MSAAPPGPLTEKALAKLKAIVAGNGIDPAKIELIGSDEAPLHLKAEMQLAPDILREQRRYIGAPNPKNLTLPATVVQSPQQMEMAIEGFKAEVAEEGGWVQHAYEEIKKESGNGWGLEDADVALEKMAQIFCMTEMCAACQGQGRNSCNLCHGDGQVPCRRCNASGQELCYTCNGTGRTMAGAVEDYCPTCRGSTMAQCRTCLGRRQVMCEQCRGQGNIVCQTCEGKGKATLEERVTPIVHCSFAMIDTAALPSGFRRAVSRGGLQSLARGHATIAIQPVDDSEKPRVFIPYTAELPYAEVRVRVAGKAMQVTVMGHKHVILDVPNFLDKLVEPRVEALEAAAAQPDALKKAMEWRVMRDAFDILQQGGDTRELRRRYPFGFSPALLERITRLIMRIVQKNTVTMRALGGGAFLGLLALAFWMIFAGGFRGMLLPHITKIGVLGFDFAAMIGAAFAMQRLLQFISLSQVRRLLGSSASPGNVTAQKNDVVDYILMALAPVLYIALLAMLKAPPNWFGH